MMNNYTVRELIYTYYEESKNYSNKDIKLLISNCFKITKKLNNIINELYKEYYRRKDIYYSNLNYYKKFGGIYPTNTFRETLNDINSLSNIRTFIYKSINDIKQRNIYDLHFKDYIDSLLNLLI